MTSRYIHRYAGENTGEYREQYRKSSTSLLEIDETEAQRITKTITRFYQDHLESAGMGGYVVGLSGGIDSTAVAYLLTEALGPENVYGVILPAQHTREEDIQIAQEIAKELGIETNNPVQFQERISHILKELEMLGEPVKEEEKQRMKQGNILARCRMIVIRDIAKAKNALVAGTTNASERDLGYMTLAADGPGGIDNEALYEIYKTTEKDLARFMGVPEAVIEKEPTADLWAGQKDTDELRFPYEVLDQVLVGLQLGLEAADIADIVADSSQEDVEQIRVRVERNRFKTELAPHPSF